MKKITYQPPPRIGEKLRENVAFQCRPASELITSALESYLNAQPGDYPDPPEAGPLPLPMYFMIDNPDGHFYDVGVGENTVSGLFEGTAKDFGGNWHTLTGIEWEVRLEAFFDAAYQMGLIGGYSQDSAIWTLPDGPDRPGKVWATDWLTENVATETFYKVLAAAYQAEFSNDLGVIAYRLAEFHGNPARLWDADLKTAVLDLAGLFRACEGWPKQGM